MYNRQAIADFMLSFIDFSKSKTFLDIGCGKGIYLIEMGKRASADSKLYGIDVMDEAIELAKTQTEGDDRFVFDLADVEDQLDFKDDSIDVIVSCNVLECIRNKDGLLKEMQRLLRPEGMMVMAHFDWDTQVFNAYDKAHCRKMIHTYSDWQQPWMNECDAWMGRRLNGILHSSNLFAGDIHTHVLVETDYKPGYKGYSVVHDEFQALVDHHLIEEIEFKSFRDEMEDLAQLGHYFYSINMYAYVGTKKEV